MTSLKPKHCEVCGTDITKDRDRCTNSRCGKCHRQWCGPGGETAPGHGRRWPEGAYRPVFEIVERDTKKVIHEIDVTSKSQRAREKVATGLSKKVDYERFFTRLLAP